MKQKVISAVLAFCILLIMASPAFAAGNASGQAGKATSDLYTPQKLKWGTYYAREYDDSHIETKLTSYDIPGCVSWETVSCSNDIFFVVKVYSSTSSKPVYTTDVFHFGITSPKYSSEGFICDPAVEDIPSGNYYFTVQAFENDQTNQRIIERSGEIKSSTWSYSKPKATLPKIELSSLMWTEPQPNETPGFPYIYASWIFPEDLRNIFSKSEQIYYSESKDGKPRLIGGLNWLVYVGHIPGYSEGFGISNQPTFDYNGDGIMDELQTGYYYRKAHLVSCDITKIANGEWSSLSEPYYIDSGVEPGPVPDPPTISFTDVKTGAYYAQAVAWAVENKVTTGTGGGKFSPENPCTRGQIATFLWNAAGKPEPKTTTNPFVDVNPGDYFYKPVLWAMENKITSGMDSTHFSPSKPCTRDQAVTFLWRSEGKPAATQASSFADVKAGSFYEAAVNWAVENKVTSGTSKNTFSPGQTCTRGQIVTFLYRTREG